MKKKILTISIISFLSIALWISVSLSEIFVVNVKVPVNYLDLPANYSVGYSSVNEIDLQVKGRGWELAKLIFGQKIYFDISVHRRIGHRKNDLTNLIKANAWLTSSFQILEINPPQIEYDIEKTGSKNVRLSKNFKLEFEPGYGLSSEVIIKPESVEIYGPANILKDIDSLRTEYKEILNVSNNFKIDFNIEIPDGISIAEKKCTIEFQVQKIVDKTFENIVVETRNVPSSKELILFPGKINVVLRGGINKLGRLTSDSIKAYVDYWSALREVSGFIEPILEVPAFTSQINIIPYKLEYIIKQY